jgi:hypothetical protein
MLQSWRMGVGREVGRVLSLAILICLCRICVKYEAQHGLILMENPIKCNYLIIPKLFFSCVFPAVPFRETSSEDILNG